MDKRIAVVAGDRVLDAVVAPGSTAADVLQQVGLPSEFFLSKRDGLPFGDSEVLFDQLRDGEKAYASSKATVGQIAEESRWG